VNPRNKYLSRRKEGLQWEGFGEKEGFKPGKKSEWVMEYQITVSMTVGRYRYRPYKILQLNALHKCHQHL